MELRIQGIFYVYSGSTGNNLFGTGFLVHNEYKIELTG
jgi:hypothetical protein